MKATELRLNNLVLAPKGIARVTEINFGFIWVMYLSDNSEDHLAIDKIQPIRITEEQLIKSGFVKSQYCTLTITVKGFTISFDIMNDICDCYLESIGIDVEYIHQLQNLYFTLTGNELTIHP